MTPFAIAAPNWLQLIVFAQLGRPRDDDDWQFRLRSLLGMAPVTGTVGTVAMVVAALLTVAAIVTQLLRSLEVWNAAGAPDVGTKLVNFFSFFTIQSNIVAAVAFAIGGVIPMVAATLASTSARIVSILGVTVVALVALGYTGARAGGAPAKRPIVRVLVGGVAAMGVTMIVGKLFGAAIA